jgi:hypothetical protein
MGYLFEVGCGLSILLNTISGGSHKNTISAKLRKTKIKYDGIIPWRKPISKIVAFILDTMLPSHLKQR